MRVDSSMVRIRAFQARGPGSIPGRRIIIYTVFQGSMAEWLRREIRNLMGSARVGSNPAADVQ